MDTNIVSSIFYHKECYNEDFSTLILQCVCEFVCGVDFWNAG